jgi:hypothetical protein
VGKPKRRTAGTKKAAQIANEAVPLVVNDDVEQVDMIAELGLPVTARVQQLRAQKQLGPGRPAGSRNKRTLEWANYLLSKYTSPLEVLAQIATAPIDELSASLGCTKLEALQEKRLAAIALKDHLHSKMPVSVDVTNRKVVHLVIGEIPGPPPPDANGVGLVGEILDLTAVDISPKVSTA